MKNIARLIIVSLIGLVAALVIGCRNECATGAVCGDYNVVGVSPVPSPTPRPSPGATPDPCRIDSVQVSWHSGAQLPFLALGASEQIDATPFNSSGATPKGCDLTREPTWIVSTPTTCSILGGGYNPFIRGFRVGDCSVTAQMVWDNRTIPSGPFIVSVR